MSGVNWMRLNFAPSMCAVARASNVFALPGGPSSKDVRARKCRDEEQFDGALLADDDLGDLGLRSLAQVDEALVRRLRQQ